MALSEALISLATAASGGLVGAAMTDTWQTFRATVARLIARGDEERTIMIESRLEEMREQIASASNDQVEQICNNNIAAWRIRFTDLLEERPEVLNDLRSLVEQLRQAGISYETSADRPTLSIGNVEMRAEAQDSARVYQQGHGVQWNV